MHKVISWSVSLVDVL